MKFGNNINHCATKYSLTFLTQIWQFFLYNMLTLCTKQCLTRGGGGGGGAGVGHLMKLVLPKVGNLTGKSIPMVRLFEWAEQKTCTKFVLQHMSEYQVSVFSQCFLIENCLDWYVVCL